MKTSTKYLIIIFAALALISFFIFSPYVERDASYELIDSEIVIDSAKVVRFEISKIGRKIVIENISGVWTITSPINYIADNSAVLTLLSSAVNLKINSLISSNPEKQILFQVDTLTGTSLSFYHSNNKYISLVIGKMGPSYMESYIRPMSSNNVYLGERLNSWLVNKNLNDWREKLILQIDKEVINNITFHYPDDTWNLILKNTSWYVNEDSADENSVNRLISSLKELRADNFIDTVVTLANPQLILNITGNISANLYPVQPDSNLYRVTVSNATQIFEISRSSADKLLKQKSDFISIK